MERDGLSGLELVALIVGVASGVVVGAVWGGAVLALLFMGELHLPGLRGAASAVVRLADHVGDPAAAWPGPEREMLPGAVVYWGCTAVAGVPTGWGLVAAMRLLAGGPVGTARRRPLGVSSRPWWAARRDLAPLLLLWPAAQRFVVARFGPWLVATESRSSVKELAWYRRAAQVVCRRRARQGDRGAVALVGPSRSGKTTAAVSGILEWTGPAVLSSVKADLLAATLGWRAELGGVRVYDPTNTTNSPAKRGAWSPIRQASTIVGAQRAARALCDAAPREGVDGGMDFWLAQAEILLSGLLFVAHHASADMGAVCEWVLRQDRPGELGPGEVRTLLGGLQDCDDDRLVCDAAEALKALSAIWEMEERTLSSTYATAHTVVWPWSAPKVARSSRGRSIDLDWLLSRGKDDKPRTLYLCSPIEDQKRLAPAFGGLLNDLINQAYRRVAFTGKPLDPPLLLVIDEAGNTPLRALPEYASTLAGIGVQLVTIWQSLAQIEASYGRQSDTVLTNHLTKLFYAGLSDTSSLKYLAQVLGEDEVETVTRSGVEHFGRASIQVSTTRVPMAPPHALRQMRPGDALLLHGTLPPAHVKTRPFYKSRRLTARADKTMPTARPAGQRKRPTEAADGSGGPRERR